MKASSKISSLLQKPAKGKIPARAKVPNRKVQKVMGIFRRSPPICIISCSSCAPWMTEPDPRNRRALKKAWVIRWKTPATKPPTPSPIIM